MLKLGIPKGSLESATIELFRKSGWKIMVSSRSYLPMVVAEDSPIRTLNDLEGRKIFTELVNFTRRYFTERGVKVEVEFSWGATEGKVIEGLCDAIVEGAETGSTLRANKLHT